MLLGFEFYIGRLLAKLAILGVILAVGAVVFALLWVSFKLNFPKSWWHK